MIMMMLNEVAAGGSVLHGGVPKICFMSFKKMGKHLMASAEIDSIVCDTVAYSLRVNQQVSVGSMVSWSSVLLTAHITSFFCSL